MPTILTDGKNTAQIARRLLAAAGAHPELVESSTAGRFPAFVVDDELARAAGFVGDNDAPIPAPPMTGEPPRSGAGATTEAWRVWIASHGLAVDELSKRDELIAQWDNHIGTQ